MINRYRHWLGEEARHMVETFDGEYVLYEDHLAVVAEKDREIEKYMELLHAVESKHPGESRHETALRYIRKAEQHDGVAVTVEAWVRGKEDGDDSAVRIAKR